MSQIGSSAAGAESAARSTALSPNTATTVLTTSSSVARSTVAAGDVTGAATGLGAAVTGVGTRPPATGPARPQAPVASRNRTGAIWEESFTRGSSRRGKRCPAAPNVQRVRERRAGHSLTETCLCLTPLSRARRGPRHSCREDCGLHALLAALCSFVAEDRAIVPVAGTQTGPIR